MLVLEMQVLDDCMLAHIGPISAFDKLKDKFHNAPISLL